jgi:hypothetical protein
MARQPSSAIAALGRHLRHSRGAQRRQRFRDVSNTLFGLRWRSGSGRLCVGRVMDHVVTVESMDTLTDPQIVAKVKEPFGILR